MAEVDTIIRMVAIPASDGRGGYYDQRGNHTRSDGRGGYYDQHGNHVRSDGRGGHYVPNHFGQKQTN